MNETLKLTDLMINITQLEQDLDIQLALKIVGSMCEISSTNNDGCGRHYCDCFELEKMLDYQYFKDSILNSINQELLRREFVITQMKGA